MNAQARFGTMISEIGFAGLPVIIQNAGFDFLILDLEHGAFDYSSVRAVIDAARAVGVKAILRLPDNGRREIIRLGDIGADGFVLPMAESAADVEQVVRYAKYAPEGARGISMTRAHSGYNPGDLAGYMAKANQNMAIYAQAETRKGLDKLSEILAVKYLDGVILGPNDLSADLNCIGDRAPVLKAMETLSEASRKAGKPAGIITGDKTLLDKARALGYGLVCVSTELNILSQGYKNLRQSLT
ncbi:MAG: aldolase/citrate lyase family protein [Firmicutes bacterium]|nr:aldolase/citrate lyase family protein [Bacillota bacterium]